MCSFLFIYLFILRTILDEKKKKNEKENKARLRKRGRDVKMRIIFTSHSVSKIN